MIPYGKQSIDDDDIAAVVSVLQSDFLTTGPQVEIFEEGIAEFVTAKYAIAVSSGTAALHCAMYAIGIEAGDEVIVPTITFSATANCVIYQGGTPIFADVRADTLLLDPVSVRERITPRTKAIIAVDYAGQPCDYAMLRDIANENGLVLVADACHALGARWHGQPVGSIADLTCFSFHPVKHICTGEGGMITTDRADWSQRMRQFRCHGMYRDYRQRSAVNSWEYDVIDLGHNYRLTDIQCALGLSQLKKLPRWLERRRTIADRYWRNFEGNELVMPLAVRDSIDHAYHLFVVKVDSDVRDNLFVALRNAGVGVNVHYKPVHSHSFYQQHLGTRPGLCPASEKAYSQIISLPMFPSLSEDQVDSITDALISNISH